MASGRLRWFRKVWRRRLDLRGLRGEVRGLRVEMARIADTLDALKPAAPLSAVPTREGDLEVLFTSPAEQQEYLNLATQFEQATGRPPTEDEILHQYMLSRGHT